MSYRIVPSLPLAGEVRRVAGAELAAAIALLESGRERRDAAVHDARKRFKRLRGLYRLVAAADPGFWRREEHRIREVAGALSSARDATAIVETVDRFAGEAGTPVEIDRLMTMRRGLIARRDRIVRRHAAGGGAVDAAIAELKAAKAALESMTIDGGAGRVADVLAAGVARTSARAAEALDKARDVGRADDFHDLRKNVKYHAMHMRLLCDAWPKPRGSRLRLADRLGDRLGEMHDIPVLRDIVEEESIGAPDDRRYVGKLLRRKERALAADCIEAATRLFAMPAEEIAARVAELYAAAAGASLAVAAGQ
jgi:CHAD domain-containing protein